MNLIELLLWYGDLIKNNGRTEANKQMHKSCDNFFWPYIETCFNDEGEFIDVKEQVVKIEKVEEVK